MTTRERSPPRPTSAPTRSSSAGGPTRCSPAPGERAVRCEVQVHGSGALIRYLLGNDDLVDEMPLPVIPRILGQGARLFPQDVRDLALHFARVAHGLEKAWRPASTGWASAAGSTPRKRPASTI